MSNALTVLSAAAPLAAGWSIHSLWMRRRIEAARRDPLTGLLTRDAFLARARRRITRVPMAVLVIDLDGFKALNDTYGHTAGDAALFETAARLDAMAHGGFAARLGGDEFAAVIHHPDPSRLPNVLRQVHEWLCVPVEFEGRPLPVGVSVGGIWSGDLPAPDLSLALRRADEAMYAAKRTGGGWLVANGPAPTHDTVNGRRAERNGTHLPTRPEGSAP